MLKIHLTAAAMACLCGAAHGGGLHWSVDAPTTDGNGFIAYGVLIASDAGNGAPNSAQGQSLNFFTAPFMDGPDIFSFGGLLPLAVQDGGPASSTTATMDLTTVVDGDGTATVHAFARAIGTTTRTGTEAFNTSSDPNNRAVFTISPEGFDPALPVRLFIDWAMNASADASSPYVLDAQLGGQINIKRTGELFGQSIGIAGADETSFPLVAGGSTTMVIAPTDLDRDFEVSVRSFGGIGISAGAGVAGPEAAGGFEAEYEVTILLRQFCPGDTDGDGRVSFADLNVVVGSFNATGEVGEHAGDLNGDGRVDFADLNMVLTNFGQQGC